MVDIDCTNIEIEQIRAQIRINNSYVVEPKNIRAFSVNKSRSSISATFSATIEIPSGASFGNSTSGGLIEIWAGTKDNYLKKKIFTGVIRQVIPNPVPGKPNYMSISLSGNDILYKLENKKFSRRIKTDGPGLFVTIEGSKTKRPSSIWAIDKRVGAGTHTYTNNTPSISDRKEHNTVTHAPDYSKTSRDMLGNGIEPVPEPGRAGQGDLIIHQHDSLSKGGPAFGVYSPT